MRRWRSLAAAVVVVAALPVTVPLPARAATRYLDVMFEVDVQRDVVYGHASSPDGSGALVELRLDVYAPRGDTETQRPVFVYAHGGAFLVGDKRDGDPVGWATRMAQRGYVAMSVNYRLGPALVLPPLDDADRAQIDRARLDMQTAVRWVKANAAELRIDPDRIAVGGSSAGAITALGVALDSNAADSVPPVPGSHGELSSSVCGAVSISGANDPAAADGGDAGAIFFHGTRDDLVPYALAFATREAMQRAGLPVDWHEYPEGHVDQFSAATREDVRAKTIQWLYARVATAPFPCSAAVGVRSPVAARQQTVLQGAAGRSGVLSLVAVDTAAPGYVQALPCRSSPGATANVNADGAGQIRSNLAIVPFDAAGTACLYSFMRTHLVADLQGYFAPGAFEDVPDTRLLDTRTLASPVAGEPPGPGATTVINGRPDSTGVVSLVATDTRAAGYVQVLPCGTAPGATSNLNVDRAGQTRGNLAFVRFDAGGRACIYQQMQAELVVDLQGYMSPAAFDDVADERLVDTRTNAFGAPMPPTSQRPIVGRPNSTAVVALFAVDTGGPGFLQVLPCGSSAGGSANLNSDAAGQIVAGLAFVRLDATGQVCVFNSMATHVVVDLQGYMQPGAFEDVPDVRLRDTRIR